MILADVRLHRMAGTAAEVSAVQAILEAVPGYSMAISGAIAPPGAGSSVFTSLPPGCCEDQKWVLGITYEQTLVGVVDLIQGYPSPSTACIGLVAISERFQKRGIGRAAMTAVEQLVRAWQGCDRMRLAIVASNGAVTPFWTALGFLPTGKTSPYASGSVTSESIIYERVL